MPTWPIHNELLDYMKASAPILLMAVDQDGYITQANAYATELLGRDPIGLSLADVFIDFTGTLRLTELARTGSGDRLFNTNPAAGLPQTLHVRFIPRGEQSFVLGRHDMSELGRLQEQTLSLNQELSNLARQLHKANAEMTRLNRLKDQFLAMATHDLRKPAGAVLNISELLADELAGTLNDEQAEFLRFLQEAGREMARLIDDFLDPSIIESGRLQLNLAPERPDAAIAEGLKYVRAKAEKKGIRLLVGGEPVDEEIVLDAPKIGQAVANLVSNAVEHSRPGSRVWIDVRRGDSEVTFRVRDEGAGMPPETLELLFHSPQAAGAQKPDGERSHGLGLMIARRIVEAHGGEIRADSTPGAGSTLEFSIPVRRPDNEES